ncbi:hypothetical protein AGR2A_Lc80175 [Agrobacterium genomosp. 2 str. CFBP 5494]|uniref:Uncharacterized protein n=1 Tax=Agrobacterium genomosp. 2 str. CFBP 5494 TaxID=1183436 RepID=A0A9W5B677_9HYPH|nr:hypothetical protein AGR2A_Lc80175 [Agrobacterium genomosp. 2 str. CFBP 5494]
MHNCQSFYFLHVFCAFAENMETAASSPYEWTADVIPVYAFRDTIEAINSGNEVSHAARPEFLLRTC